MDGRLSAENLAISKALLKARLEAAPLSGFPGDLPNSPELAYAIQDHTLAAWPDDLVGWKVGGTGKKFAEEFGAAHLAGPIFTRNLFTVREGKRSKMPIFVGGFAAVEAEFVIRLGAEREQDRLFVGVEVASSPVPAINDYGPLAVMCDFGNNNGLLVGSEITEWQGRSRPIQIEVVIDGICVGAETVSDYAERSASARDFLLSNAAQRGLDLPEGTLICTGALTGIHEAEAGALARVSFEEFGVLELELVPARPI